MTQLFERENLEKLPFYTLGQLVSGLDLDLAPKSPAIVADDAAVTLGNIISTDILKAHRNSQDGDAWLYKRLMAGLFCFDHAAKCWDKFQGQSWVEDFLGEHLTALGGVIDCYCDEADRQSKLATEAARNGKKEQQDGHLKKQKELLLRVLQLQTKHRKEDVLFLAAQGADGLGIRGDEWDADPMLLGCTNGVVDLQDGSFRDGHPGDFIKTTSPTEWKGINAPCPTFEKFISEVIVDDKLNPDPKTTAYLQRFMGYGITGKISEHVLPVLVGEEGRGGKGTLLEALAFTLGPLARKVPSELLLAKSRSRDSSAASPDLMDLRGRRLCWCNETNEGRKLDLSLAKELAGGDTISARQLHGRIVNFIPSHLLILSTNYAPKIPSKTNDPIWDRITSIPFRLKFVDDPIAEHERKRDRELLSSLKLEAPGVLAWLVRGALAWQSEGLNPPDNVRAATKAYQKSEDTVGRFLEDCVEENKVGMEQAGPLFAAYELWCEDAPTVSVGKTAFGIYLTKRYDKTKGKTKFYLGIKLK